MAQGAVKNNATDELDEAADRGRRDREYRKEATPPGSEAAWFRGVEDNVKDEWAGVLRGSGLPLLASIHPSA